MNQELGVTSSPWFLDELSIVDLTYITHVERMCASVAYWSGRQIRGDRWPNIERWMQAFESMPSYMATKSDYYTHITDIPPQYGPGYSLAGSQAMAATIGMFSIHFSSIFRVITISPVLSSLSLIPFSLPLYSSLPLALTPLLLLPPLLFLSLFWYIRWH